ncbi:stage V sporulation protein AD [Clostridium oryzae]|uniref:Stage V sporulation protein AD n=1 Tax=Clostridium oryzae TaxID=1450648 RepID=A0A1V4IQZ3_9CLOT|nr:stage V sporulation protein AD [Clostridium oryzae]OPJ62441.1 stage V sporulation protein AD [Clostridium oryzae]
MLQGRQTWIFNNNPVILSSAAVGGPFEGQGNIKNDFDKIYDDIWLGQESFEKAERKMVEDACDLAIKKANLKKDDINFFICGDLLNQIISSSFSARTLSVPFLGVFGACSSSMESLAIASMLIESNHAKYVLAGASSHNAGAEKQYRYPTEYGGQKPPTAQWTVTGAGIGLVSYMGEGPKVTSATIGKVIDMGLTDPFNMGAAMAPAAVDTIETHFKETERPLDYYDLILTGDLGNVGYNIALDLFKKDNFNIPIERYNDCGLIIYKQDQNVFSGGSGCGCSATVTYGHLINRLKRGEIKKILVTATGALMSPMSYQQKETIPCIAHAVSIEM